MTDRTGIFEGDDPMVIFRRWLDDASATEPNDPNAIALATVASDGMPSVRIVLLKEIEEEAFVFYTNYESRKGQEIAKSGKAAFVLHSKTLGRQIRVTGHVSREEGPQADRYYRSRDLGSRIGAWASRQSRPLSSRAELVAQVQEAERAQGDDPARPSFWGGFRLVPSEIEFWANGEHRLHDRFVFTRGNPPMRWQVTRLNP